MFFFFNQKTAYEMRISDWSSDVCSSDLGPGLARGTPCQAIGGPVGRGHGPDAGRRAERRRHGRMTRRGSKPLPPTASAGMVQALAALYKGGPLSRSEEHTSAPVTNAHLVCRLLLEKKKHKQNQQVDH